MDLYSKKQKEINRIKTRMLKNYPAIWSKIIRQFQKPGSKDRAWLTYSANYLFRTKNVRWAIDPFTLKARLSAAEDVDIASDLASLSFVLLTHNHADHLDLGLIHALRETSIHWVVPFPMLENVINSGIKPEFITVPEPSVPIKIENMVITPFDGLHFHKNKTGERLGVPATGYLVEQEQKRWLFPGDTRNFQSDLVPSFGPVDMVFAHLWLGKASALLNSGWLLDKFCQFYLALNPERITITHLSELGRDANDFWDVSHAKIIKTRFSELSPETDIAIGLIGQQFDL